MEPGLEPLKDNGGPTPTLTLLPTSTAINAGDDATCAMAPMSSRDPRGQDRRVGAHCDIGAFEYVAAKG